MNWIDRAVTYLSPEAGLRRSRARAALQVVRAYDAGKTTRRTSGWSSSGTSANAEAVPSLSTVRNRSRELVRNNPHALRAINILTAKSIGTGIRARWDKGAQPAWKEFEENCDFEGDLDMCGIQTMLARAAFESGEVLVRRVRERAGRVPLKLQVLEADYLDSTKFGVVSNGNYVVAGVEVDSLGRKQAYWLYDQHPGETVYRPLGLTSKRVAASEIILLGEKLRPGQLRYMARLAASMMRLRDYDDYRDALIVKKKIEACFAAFVIGGTPSTPLGEGEIDSTTGKRTETLSPGMIDYVNGGQDVKFANPSTGSDDGFSTHELHAIAAGAGVTHAQLTGDLSQVNYSSIRAGMADFRDLVEAWRWTCFIPMAMRRIGEWFLDAAWTAGSVRTQNYGVVWTPPAWPYVNPVDDIQAAKEEMRAGIQSLSEKIRERGYDPQEVFAEIQGERKELKDKNIVVDSDAAVPVKGGDPVAAAAASAEAGKLAQDKADQGRALVAAVTMLAERQPNVNMTIGAGAIAVDARSTHNLPAGAIHLTVPTPAVKRTVKFVEDANGNLVAAEVEG